MPLTPRMRYIEAIGIRWPGCQCHVEGDVDSYETLVWDAGDPIPPKAEMDFYILTPTEEEYTLAVTNFMDAKAQERKYDSIHTAALRAAYPGPFQAEGVAYASWMDSVWISLYSKMGRVLQSQEPYPSIDELLASLPPLVLPDRPAGAA